MRETESLQVQETRLQEIVPGVYRWSSTLHGPQHPVNSYLWRGPHGVVLVDPAGDLTPVALQSIAIGEVAAILVTHVQEEHITGAVNFPRAPLYVPHGDEYLCQGKEVYENCVTSWQPPWDWESRGNFRGHLGGALNERPPLLPLPAAGVLRAGDELLGLKTLATPGHGKNALTFVTEVGHQRIAFCGDLICAEGKLWNWFDCDWDYGPQGGQKALLHSAQSLLSQGCDVLLPAHGPPILEPGRELSALVERLNRVLSQESFDAAPSNGRANSSHHDARHSRRVRAGRK